MKKLLLPLLCCIVAYGSYGQVAITVDETGKITYIKKSGINKISLNGQFEKQNNFATDIQKNLQKLAIKNVLFNDIISRKTAFTPSQNIYGLHIPVTKYILHSKKDTVTREYAEDSTRVTASMYPNGDATLKRSNADLIALKEYYNQQYNDKVYTTWMELYNIENSIIHLRDYIFNIQLSILNSNIEMSNDVSNNINTSMNAITKALKQLETDNKIQELNTWMYNTSALSGRILTMNSLGIVSTDKLPLLPDTAKLASSIRTLTTKLNKDADYNYSAVVMEQKLYNLQIQLEKIQAYHKQIQQSTILKKQFAEYTILAKFKKTDSITHYRFHDATDELKLTNDEETKQTIYKNKDKVLIYTYNIPPKGELAYDIKTAGYTEALQFSRLAGGALKRYQLTTINQFEVSAKAKRSAPDQYAEAFESYNKILDTLQAYQEAIAIYTASIPPAEKVEFAKDIDQAYTTRIDKLKDLQNDSNYKHTYTLGLKVDGKEVIKPKSFNFITYKRSRIQFAAGVHFFSGNAPMVVTEGTGFKTVSYNTPRYSAGVKVYVVPQTFADVNSRTWFKTMICSWHVALLADASKPLENQYLGIGVDIMPGLGINAGPHFYRYTAYQLYNNAVVGEKKTLKVRDGLQVSLTMDGGLAKDIFTTFLKLF